MWSARRHHLQAYGAAMVIIIATAGCAADLPEPEPILRPVRYEAVTSGSSESRRTLAAVARAGRESTLGFRVAGTVESISANLGDTVRQGDELASLDPIDYELRLEEALASLANGEASLRKSQSDYSRVKALYEDNNAAKSELDATRAAAESSRAQVQAAIKRRDQAQQRVGYTVLRAPVDGAIAQRSIEVSENVEPGDPAFLLTSGSRTEVRVAVPGVIIDQVREGQPVSIKFNAFPAREYAGSVTEVGVAVTGSASIFQVTARLDDQAPEIRSGMAAEVTFKFRSDSQSDAVSVPWVAVGEDREGRFVFVLEPAGDGTGAVRRRAVVLGELLERIEILEGLSEGELVVTAGVRRLTDGMTVSVSEG